MKKFLVTGGTGLLGNNLIRELLQSGHAVTAAIRESSPRKPLEGLSARVLTVDFNSSEAVADSLTDIDAVIHSAGFIWFGWNRLKQSRQVNVGITERLAQACLDKHIPLVHISSLDALPIGNSREDIVDETALDNRQAWSTKVQCNYVVSKTEADQVVQSFFSRGLTGCILHPGLMFGPYDWKPSSGEMIQAISRLGLLFACPTGGISVTDVREVARAAIRAAQEPAADGKHYILAGHNVAYRELCDLIADKCGVMRPRGRTGPLVYGLAAMVGGVSSLVGRESMLNTGMIGMARLWHYYSSQRAVDELGYQVPDLAGILDDAIQWLASERMIKLRSSA